MSALRRAVLSIEEAKALQPHGARATFELRLPVPGAVNGAKHPEPPLLGRRIARHIERPAQQRVRKSKVTKWPERVTNASPSGVGAILMH